ncbi:MAG: nitronate monooxygenase [Bacteroidales bacterium]|nr:nitronate monooxygenase [Bacteroidales bacterium]
MKELIIGNLKIKNPIIQGGMGVCISLSGLAAAVANEGGVGVISAVGIGMTEPNYRSNFRESNKIALRKEIRKARQNSDGVIGVNTMLAVSDFDDLLRVSIEEKVDIVFLTAGLPLKKPDIDLSILENTNTKFIPKVSSPRAASLIFQHWSDRYNRIPDAVVLEGPLSGGHLGFRRKVLEENEILLTSLVKGTINELEPFKFKYGKEIPVIAAGGIYSGIDIFEIMEAGASAVKMGTRFVTTHECDASDSFKQNYLKCSKEDITLIDSPVGLPGRVISNDFVQQIKMGKKKPINCPWKCLKTCNYANVQFCIAEALFNAAKGNFHDGFSFAGTNAYLANEIYSVKEVFDQLKSEFNQASLMMEKLSWSA